MAEEKKIMCVLLLVMLTCTYTNEKVAADGPHDTCCAECFAECTPPLGEINLICLKRCWADCAKVGWSCKSN